MAELSKWSLIGIPDHQAVIPVGGRIGAALGPRAFRSVFRSFKGREGVLESMTDRGDAGPLGPRVEDGHRQAADAIAAAQASVKGPSVVVGGSHDYGFPHLQGVARATRAKILGCLNIDAHLDVRKPSPQITSGSPFYLALEAGVIAPEHFIEFGIQAHCNSKELWAYIESKGSKVVPLEALRRGKAVPAFREALDSLSDVCDAVVVSLDLDAAAQCFAPGVSAPQAEGFSSSELVEFCEIAGNSRAVRSLGIFELNPEHDVDQRTARLAATCAYHFVAHALKR